MGPQHTRCGKTGDCEDRKSTSSLQWGRNILVAERPPDPRCRRRHLMASMGPQHTRCGKAEKPKTEEPAAELQWGRNILVAERLAIPRAIPVGAATLQWGRNILVAESMLLYPLSTSSLSFNGAATYSLRKADLYLRKTKLSYELQWGRNILVAESHHANAGIRRESGASMGPQHTRCGKSLNMADSRKNDYASMGPQHTRCGKSAACFSTSAKSI